MRRRSLLDAPLDMVNYYSGDTNLYSMFDNWGHPRKTFYAFKAFRMLLDTPVLVALKEIDAGKSICAVGKNEGNTAVTLMLSNYKNPDAFYEIRLTNLPWSGPGNCEIFVVDEKHNLEITGKQSFSGPLPTLRIPSQTSSVVVVRATKS